MSGIALPEDLFAQDAGTPSHAIAMHGQPALEPDYQRFSFADSRTVSGGALTQAIIGGFDSLNPFLVRGNAAEGLRQHIFESLLVRHNDEPFSLYGLLAGSVSMPPDRSAVTFTLRPEARFSDGQPVTVDDVIFSYQTLKAQGRPNHRYYYGKVSKLERPSDNQVTFIFDPQAPDRELPLIMGLMPIFPKHIYADNFTAGLKDPIGSGPYVVDDVKPGRQIVYRRNPNYWGNDFAFTRGRNNIDILKYDYYRDENSAFEAFKAGLVDVWFENDPLRWQNGYTFPAARDGRIVKENIATGTPSGLRGFVFNTRRDFFADKTTRRALAHVFNADWVNKSLYSNAYRRTQSYFQNADLSALQHAADRQEKRLLSGARLSEGILQKGFTAPTGDVTGRNRAARQQAIEMLEKSGYSIINRRMVNKRSQQPLAFEILVQTREDERLALAYRRMLNTIGVQVHVRFVDATQYQNRLQTFDFDMIIYDWYASLSPGNEQAFYWGGEAAGQNGSRNYAGIRSKYIDRAIAALTRAQERQDFIRAARALDRLLMDGHYVVPLFHPPAQWVARWNHVEHSWRHALYGAQLDSWWINPEN